jgi:NAD(P)H dehydrogenase (quinone)
MILVGAATGRIGSRTMNLLADDDRFRAVAAGVRDVEACRNLKEQGISVRAVDYDDIDGLESAFEGVERVVLIPSFADTEQRAQQGRNVIQAAQKRGVKQIVFIGIMDTRSDSPLPFAHAYGAIEKALRESKVGWTVLRTSMYTDNLAEQYPPWLEHGELLTCAGDGRISYVSRDDIAASIIGVLASPVEEHADNVYTLTGPDALSYEDVCEVINDFFDAQVKVAHVAVEEFAERLNQIWGVAYPGIKHVARVTPLFQTVFKQGLMSEVTDHVERLTGTAPEDVRSWLARNVDPQK